jgi:hypothetical protein
VVVADKLRDVCVETFEYEFAAVRAGDGRRADIEPFANAKRLDAVGEQALDRLLSSVFRLAATRAECSNGG